MKEVKFNINHFKIGEYENGYKYFLYFLIRYFFSADNFSGKVSKKEFLELGEQYNFQMGFLKQVWRLGKKDNLFIRSIKVEGKEEFIFLKTLHLEQKGSMIIMIQNDLLKKVVNISIFRSLCYIVIASNINFSKTKVKKVQYISMNPSRSLTTIGRSFGDVGKSVMSKRMKKAQQDFSQYFNITHRYTTYNNYKLQINNLYSIQGITYKYTQPKQDDLFIVRPQFISKKTVSFGDWRKSKDFLPVEMYKLAIKNLFV